MRLNKDSSGASSGSLELEDKKSYNASSFLDYARRNQSGIKLMNYIVGLFLGFAIQIALLLMQPALPWAGLSLLSLALLALFAASQYRAKTHYALKALLHDTGCWMLLSGLLIFLPALLLMTSKTLTLTFPATPSTLAPALEKPELLFGIPALLLTLTCMYFKNKRDLGWLRLTQVATAWFYSCLLFHHYHYTLSDMSPWINEPPEAYQIAYTNIGLLCWAFVTLKLGTLWKNKGFLWVGLGVTLVALLREAAFLWVIFNPWEHTFSLLPSIPLVGTLMVLYLVPMLLCIPIIPMLYGLGHDRIFSTSLFLLRSGLWLSISLILSSLTQSTLPLALPWGMPWWHTSLLLLSMLLIGYACFSYKPRLMHKE